MIVERIRKIVEYYGLSDRAFCRKIGVAVGFVDNVKNPGADKLESILRNFEEIDADWLVTGRGSMLKESPSMVMEPEPEYQRPNYKELYEECKEHNQTLKQMISLMGKK